MAGNVQGTTAAANGANARAVPHANQDWATQQKKNQAAAQHVQQQTNRNRAAPQRGTVNVLA